MSAMFIDGSKFCEQFLKEVTQGTILWNYFEIWPAVSKEKNFEEFLWSPHSIKSLPPWRPCFSTDQNFANKFWKWSHKEHSCEIIPNSECGFGEEDFLRISSCPYSAKSLPPHHGGHVFRRIKNSRTVFLKRVTQETFLWKYFKIRPGVSEKKIFQEFLYVRIVQKVSRPWPPCFSTVQNFANNFWKGSPKKQSCEIISKSDKRFQRRRSIKKKKKNP